MGYCYGGGLALEMLRRGVPLNMVFSYHGALGAVGKLKKGQMKGRIFVFTGADDPFVPAKLVASFEKQMTAIGAKYQLFSYEHAVHAFTNPDATALGKKFKMPIAYNAHADEDSWAKTLTALKSL
jgi:dienelactone hydrolase